MGNKHRTLAPASLGLPAQLIRNELLTQGGMGNFIYPPGAAVLVQTPAAIVQVAHELAGFMSRPGHDGFADLVRDIHLVVIFLADGAQNPVAAVDAVADVVPVVATGVPEREDVA